jgi:hypothetical protein
MLEQKRTKRDIIMYKINVKKNKNSQKDLKPTEMLSRENYDKCFQQYTNGKYQPWYYINCGVCEESVVVIWEDEDGNFKFSTDDKSSLAELLPHVTVREVNLSLEMKVENV